MTIKFSGYSAATVAFLQNFVLKVFQDKEGCFNKEDDVNMDLTIGIKNDINTVAKGMPIDKRNVPSRTSNAFYTIFSDLSCNGILYNVKLYLNDAMFIRMAYHGIIPVDFDK